MSVQWPITHARTVDQLRRRINALREAGEIAPGGGSGGTALTDGTTINGDGTAGDRIRLDPDVQADIDSRLATVNKLSEFATMQDKRDALTNLGLTKIRGGTF